MFESSAGCSVTFLNVNVFHNV